MAIVEECLVAFKQLHEQQYKSYPNQSIQVNYAVFFSSEYNAKRYLKIIQSLGVQVELRHFLVYITCSHAAIEKSQ